VYIQFPCKADYVICVGALADNATSRYSSSLWASNYGTKAVNIWAPTNQWVGRNKECGACKVDTFGGPVQPRRSPPGSPR
jgi:hypothetical protein